MPLVQELLMNVQQWWFKKLCKGDESLEDEECSGWLSEVDDKQPRASSQLMLLQLREKLPQNSALTILWSFSIWSKLERWKSSVSDCLMNWLQIKINGHFEVSSFLILHNNNKPFLSWFVMCDMWILYNNWQWLVQWLDWEAPKA